MTIIFTNQFTCEDVNRCVSDLEESGAEVQSTSLFKDELYCKIEVTIENEGAFRSLFELTESYIQSDY